MAPESSGTTSTASPAWLGPSKTLYSSSSPGPAASSLRACAPPTGESVVPCTVESELMSRTEIEIDQRWGRDTRYALVMEMAQGVPTRHATLHNALTIARDCLHAVGKKKYESR